MATQRMRESWAKMKDDIRGIWGADLTDDVLKEGRRDLNKMVNIIHRTTGNSRAQIRKQMSALL